MTGGQFQLVVDGEPTTLWFAGETETTTRTTDWAAWPGCCKLQDWAQEVIGQALVDAEQSAPTRPCGALVHVNALLLQQVLAEPEWEARLGEADRRSLTRCSGRTSTPPAGSTRIRWL